MRFKELFELSGADKFFTMQDVVRELIKRNIDFKYNKSKNEIIIDSTVDFKALKDKYIEIESWEIKSLGKVESEKQINNLINYNTTNAFKIEYTKNIKYMRITKIDQ